MVNDSPGDRAQRVLAYGHDLNALVKQAVAEHKPMLESMGFFHRLCKMPKWQQVEIYLGLHERSVWSTEIPEGSRLERAIWYIEREMPLFHKHVLSAGQ